MVGRCFTISPPGKLHIILYSITNNDIYNICFKKRYNVNNYSGYHFSSVQSLSRVQLLENPWTTEAHQASMFITNSELTQIHVHQVSDTSQPSHSLSSLLLLPSIFPTIRVFSNEAALLIRWPKYWIFSFNISPSKEYLGLISFRMDWLDLLAVQRTLKSLLQNYSSKASVLWCSALFGVKLSHPCMTTGKTIALTRQTFVGRVISLLFDMLCWV